MQILGLSKPLGSSPRVWGQDKAFKLFIAEIGIIPTRVGTSPLREQTLSIFQDHPHACGDKERDFPAVVG